MFMVLRMQLVTSRTILLGGDFNCTVELDGRTGSDSAGMDVTSRLLVETTGEASLRDVVRSMGPNARNYSWSRPDGSVSSWIDFLFTSQTVKPGRNSMVAVHFSDHRAVSFEGELTGKFPAGPGSWKLNYSLLENEELVANLSHVCRVEGHEGPLSLRRRVVGMGEGQVPELLPGCKQSCCKGKEEGFQAVAKQTAAPV
ncbi:hypothetical protein NDU88_002616 [Pleurodeles waltl]|uniref:Endonuclease/exonuclease/phosphatase domain-containing protein n=1 Tax=Pleurodeles waltl TaxID=8319 RepID=A0AAV7RD94_PLEWA|nr:hypothetical protein NDU88_002616 [Pleurodeles waltl]